METSLHPSAPRVTGLERPPHKILTHGYLASLTLMMTSLFVMNGCQVVEGIFKAGVWVGVLIGAVILAVIGGIAAMVRT